MNKYLLSLFFAVCFSQATAPMDLSRFAFKKIDAHIFLPNIYHEQEELLARVAASCDRQKDFYHLYRQIKLWLLRRNIGHPPNIEFSVKISKEDVKDKRYVIQLPLALFGGLEPLVDELLEFLGLPAAVKTFIKTHDAMRAYALIFAVDFSYPARAKAYLDYGVGQWMASCEWFLNQPDVIVERNYYLIHDGKIVEHYCQHNLSQSRFSAYKKLLPSLELPKALIKNKQNDQTFCIKCKPQMYLCNMLENFITLTPNNNQALVKKILDPYRELLTSWVHVAKKEVACYLRKYPWYTLN